MDKEPRILTSTWSQKMTKSYLRDGQMIKEMDRWLRISTGTWLQKMTKSYPRDGWMTKDTWSQKMTKSLWDGRKTKDTNGCIGPKMIKSYLHA